ncbi:MAG: AmmeMemoRadiSam system protein A [Acidobacteriaceae bacterium]
MSSNPQLATENRKSSANECSGEERRYLLRLAHQSIRASLRGEELDPSSPSAHLAELRGAFTTLHVNGKLRGCIGYVIATAPLYQAVIETAASAAFEDPRFLPVRDSEAPLLQIEISVLSPMFPVRAEDVEVGKHGLLISHHGHRGLLLPQVPIEWGWDRERFLSETCRKAGLPADSWRCGAGIEAFTAEVFGEASPCESLRD